MRPSSDPSILYSTGSDTFAGVEWSYVLVADKATGNLRYIAVVYGRGILAGIQPSRNSVPVDGKMVAAPSTDGSLFVIDSTLNCHRGPLTPLEATELGRELKTGMVYGGAMWRKVQPFLRLYQTSE